MAAVAPASAAATNPSAKGKKASDAMVEPVEGKLGLARLPDRNAGTVHPGHLPGSHAQGPLVPRVDNGIAFHMPDHPPAKKHRAPLLRGGLALSHHFKCLGVDLFLVPVLGEVSSGDRTYFLQGLRPKSRFGYQKS